MFPPKQNRRNQNYWELWLFRRLPLNVLIASLALYGVLQLIPFSDIPGYFIWPGEFTRLFYFALLSTPLFWTAVYCALARRFRHNGRSLALFTLAAYYTFWVMTLIFPDVIAKISSLWR